MITKDKPLKTYTVQWTETRTVDVVATTPADAVSTAMVMGGNVERKHGYIVLKDDYVAQESSTRCVRDECYEVRSELIDIINNFKFEAGEEQKP